MQIHATNINGLGAIQVVKSFLDSLEENPNALIKTIYLPNIGDLSNYKSKVNEVKFYNRILPIPVSRFLECIFSKMFFKNEPTIVLGDIPLRGIYGQVVLVHYPYMAYPKVNEFSSKKIKARIVRYIFSKNIKYTKRIIVQTGAMAKDLINSYPELKNKTLVCPQPAPNWLDPSLVTDKKRRSKKISMFYPATYSPYKNHDFLLSINEYAIKNNIDTSGIEIKLTLKEEEFNKYRSIKFVKNLGRLNEKHMNLEYQKTDVLLFLSSLETYGLPLVEALTIKLPVLVADFNYSRWICEDEGYYFKHRDEKSFFRSLNLLTQDLRENKTFDYSKILKKFPISWNMVVDVFINQLDEK